MAWQDLRIYSQLWEFGPKNEDGTVTTHGFFQYLAPLPNSYLLSARLLIEQSDLPLVAVPVLYLQRHALELSLKDLMSLAYEIKADLLSIKTGARVRAESASNSHIWERLLADAKTALAEVGHVLPLAFDEAVRMVNGFERGAPERFRYDWIKIKTGEQKGVWESSFSGDQALGLVPLQNHLERALEDHCVHLGDTRDEEQNLLTDLADYQEHLTRELHEAGLL